MSTKAVTLQHNKWVRLTDADQQGTCYVRQLPDAHFVYINHTENPGAGPPDTIDHPSAEEIAAGLDDLNAAFPLSQDFGIIEIPVDSSADVYYALYIDRNPETTEAAILGVDVV